MTDNTSRSHSASGTAFGMAIIACFMGLSIPVCIAVHTGASAFEIIGGFTFLFGYMALVFGIGRFVYLNPFGISFFKSADEGSVKYLLQIAVAVGCLFASIFVWCSLPATIASLF